MIVDLVRNDLGKVCRPGSVEVAEHKRLESYHNVHHLVSRVTGRLDEGMGTVDLIRAAFPGGSITGAPKRRAREIIAELEPAPRGLYTGSIGYLGTNGESQGIIPFLKLHNDQLVAVNQGGKRRGSGCAYLESWHNDVFDFLGTMFLRAKTRKKDGKLHRYWSVVESRRTADDRVLQRQVLGSSLRSWTTNSIHGQVMA